MPPKDNTALVPQPDPEAEGFYEKTSGKSPLQNIAKLLGISAEVPDLEGSVAKEIVRIRAQLADLLRNYEDLIGKAGIAAHDLNNKLSAATIVASIISNPDDILILALSDMAALIRNLQQEIITKTKGRTIPSTVIPLMKCNLSAFIDGVTKVFQCLNPDIQLTVKVNSDQSAWFYQRELRSALENLLSNAKKAGATEIEIAVNEKWAPDNCSEGQSQSSWTALSIRDNGRGISDGMKGRIFDAFATSDSGNGMGLGLPSVKRAVKKHNGQILVESEIGEGSFTKFTILLPNHNLSDADATSKPEGRQTRSIPERKSLMPSHPVISVSEHPESLLEYQRWVESEGGQCQIIDPDKQLTSIINSPRNSVIIIDDRPELTSVIKKSRPDLTIILCCNELPADTIDVIYDHFLKKPVTSELLIEILENIGGDQDIESSAAN
jgi:signal transduction histidine kinase